MACRPLQGSLLVPMLRHQRLALAWMCKREQALGATSRVLGGILADDQGLGKTVSTIALILTNTPERVEEEEAKRARQREAESVDLVSGWAQDVCQVAMQYISTCILGSV